MDKNIPLNKGRGIFLIPMDFVDQVTIHVKAGDGGRGCVSFRREKYVPRGGPNGGDGGNGGDVIIQAHSQLTTLLDLKYQKRYQAKRGEHGKGSDKHGRNAPDLIIKVPLGSVVRETETGRVLKDLIEPDDSIIVAKGGRGGRGNARFLTAQQRAPHFAEDGEEGEECWLQLDLKLLADVGLVGYPNAGKSTLISRISSAHPKVADYPFTTLTPNLGVVRLPDYRSFVVADIPGLIEGAHQGVGLGDRFLRHIERTKLLLHLVDVSVAADDPVINLRNINRELESFNPLLMEKSQIVVATKIDSLEKDKLSALQSFCEEIALPLIPISSHTGEGINVLLQKVSYELLKKEVSLEPTGQVP